MCVLDNSSNVVFLDRELSRSKEAERLLLERISLDRNRECDDMDYAIKSMDLQVRELAWAKKWGVT